MKIEEFDRITGLTGVLPQRAQRSQSLIRFLSRRPPRPFDKLRVNSAQGRPLAVTASPPPPFPGARPLKRYLQRELETRIGRAIVAGQVPNGARITVDVEQGELSVEVEASENSEAKEEAEV